MASASDAPDARGATGRAGAAAGRSLSGRVLWLTVGFVLLAQIAISVPLLASEHQGLLRSRIAAAQTAVLALEETTDNQVSPRLRQELLANAGVKAVALKRDDARLLFLADDATTGMISKVYDLRETDFLSSVGDALETLIGKGDRLLRIVDTPRLGAGQFIEAIAEEKPIHQALGRFARRTFLIGLAIAAATGALVFVTLNYALVRPIRRLARSMTVYSKAPEDPARLLKPSARADEIGEAERALADMQRDVRAAFTQRVHLAAMGEAVAKINHDLRNILASAQLVSERLEGSTDEAVRRMAPRLVRAIDRAIALASDTLDYGKAGESPPDRTAVDLRAFIDDVALAAGVDAPGVAFRNDAPEGLVVALDQSQIYRALLNLARNAVQAMGEKGGALKIAARSDGAVVSIDVIDSGSGVPARVLPTLFRPFGGVGRATGTGLGLSIAREIARNHGGDLVLVETGPAGARFRMTLPMEEEQGP